MKTSFSSAVLAVLFVVPSQCFALWGIAPVSTERAKELGMEVRSTAAGHNQVRVELEFKAEGLLKNFSRVDLRFGEGDNPPLTAPLKEDRPQPGRVVVSFNAGRAQLEKISLWVMVPESLGGTIYVLRMEEFVEPEKGRDAQSDTQPGDPKQLLHAVTQDDVDLRRRAAADLCILVLKKNGVWRRRELFDVKIPTEEGIRMEVEAVRTSDQTPDLAIANMCADCMGMLKTGTWRTAPVEKADPLEQELIRIVKATEDHFVKTILLVGLASSPTTNARDLIVASTADADPGVRKSATFLVEKCSRNYFGPLGNIHMGSPASDVEAAGRKIRAMYKTDKTLSGSVNE